MASTKIKEKKDKSEKKERKEKKKSSKTAAAVEPVSEPESVSEPAPASDVASSPEPASRKRKRIVAPEDELEVDVNAPEPLSKKELRRAKKGKVVNKPDAAAKAGITDNNNDNDAAAADGTATKAGAAKPAEKSIHGIWIGNLPWTATKESLRTFICEHASLTDEQITRVHMPAPDKASVATMRIKPTNKGFAYVDFSDAEAVQAAIGASETLMGGRRVLIKDAHSFAGRPQKDPAEKEKDATKALAVQASGGKEPSRRVFVGNLAFDVTKEDLLEHYAKCGPVADLHMATFQDSGKCKGYAWVTFETLDAAAAAVAGFVRIPVERDDDSSDEEEEEENDDDEDMPDADAAATSKPKKAKKPKKEKLRKWFVNRLGGRALRAEFAEDAQTRYKKRYGKDSKGRGSHGNDNNGGEADAITEVGSAPAPRPRRQPYERKKVDARTIAPGAALASAPRSSGAIVEARGKKITF
ncbi:uncharacterized protein K452DRAFT_290631, partial [Aplosporella prunicola CBS 121167]